MVDDPKAGIGAIRRAVAVLSSGGLVAFPTETVYGLGADASNPTAVRRVFEVKGRPVDHPLIVHLGALDQLDDWARDVPDAARVLSRTFWPGPLTMILRRSNRVVDEVTGGRETVGLRIPDHGVALEMLRSFGGGVAAPSANRFGRVSPTSADHVRADLGDDVDFILDGGPCTVGVESTIVDLSGDEPEVLRPGGISADLISQVLAMPVRLWGGERDVAAPGTLASHYAPEVRVEIVAVDEVPGRCVEVLASGLRVGVLGAEEIHDLPVEAVVLEAGGGPDGFARVLYERLRDADRLGLDILLVQPPEPIGVGVAIHDRLKRAAHVRPR